MRSMVFGLRNVAPEMRGKFFKLAGKFFLFGSRRHIYKVCKKALGIWFF